MTPLQELTKKIHKYCPDTQRLNEHSHGPFVSKGTPGWYYAYMDEDGLNQHSKVFETEEDAYNHMWEHHSESLPISLEHVLKAIRATKASIVCDFHGDLFIIKVIPYPANEFSTSVRITWILGKSASEQSEETINGLNGVIV